MSTITQREFALEITRQLRSAGFEALWAGGCVRDQLMGLEPKDYDVATNARPEQVQELFGKRRTLAIGAAFGVIAVLNKQCKPVEVATFRSDGAYVDGRHPSSIEYTTAGEDAQRRDFTINGMFFDPLSERVIDYVGGQDDLEAKIIRAIGDAQARIAEDKLRMLRAIRFASNLHFSIEPNTLRAIQSMAPQIEIVSAERINIELTRLLVHPNRSTGLQLLASSRLLGVVLPELFAEAANNTARWSKTLENLGRLNTENISTVLAALFSEIGHSSSLTETANRYRFSSKEIQLAAWLSKNLGNVEVAAALPWSKLQRILVHDGATELLALARAVLGTEHPGVLACENGLALPADKLNPPPLLTGDDLVLEGWQPGPHFGPLLTSIRDAQLEGSIVSRAEALQLAEHLGRGNES